MMRLVVRGCDSFAWIFHTGLYSSHGQSYTSMQCWGYPGLCRRWSMPPGHPDPTVQILECQKWQIHLPNKMAWLQYVQWRKQQTWQCHLKPPIGVSGDILMPQRTTCGRLRKAWKTTWDHKKQHVRHTNLWFTNGVENSEIRRKLAK